MKVLVTGAKAQICPQAVVDVAAWTAVLGGASSRTRAALRRVPEAPPMCASGRRRSPRMFGS